MVEYTDEVHVRIKNKTAKKIVTTYPLQRIFEN